MTMTKYVKFALTETGDLVYRNTGQIYLKKYTIKGNTVYGANKRKIGNIGKPNKEQSKKIERAKANRQKKIDTQIKKFGGNPKEGNLGFRDLADAGEVASYGSVPLDRYQQELSNLAIQLRDCVDAGFMTEKTAQSFLNRWMGAKNDAERKAVWTDVKRFFVDKGYNYE